MVMEIRNVYTVDVFGGNKIIFAGTVGYKAQEDLKRPKEQLQFFSCTVKD